MSDAGLRCHVCGCRALRELPGLAGLARVTSDCRPWPGGRELYACPACGVVQKPVDAAFEAEARAIYDGYAIYAQAGGLEQAVFDQADGASCRRCERVAAFLGAKAVLPAVGRLLDIGCGNGAMLAAFLGTHPGWRGVGTESSAKYRDTVEALPGVQALHTGPLAAIPGTFDLVSLVHVLEHIPDPTTFLGQIRDKLVPGGRLLIETPHVLTSPFDLVIADHCTHLTLPAAVGILETAGFTVEAAGTDWVHKELTLVARLDEPAATPRFHAVDPADLDRVAGHIRWLDRLSAQARNRAAAGPLGVFGTSIAAGWLFGELDGQVAFFLDEDTARVGRPWLGRPVRHPRDATAKGPVLLALPRKLAEAIKARLEAQGTSCELLLPPPEVG